MVKKPGVATGGPGGGDAAGGGGDPGGGGGGGGDPDVEGGGGCNVAPLESLPPQPAANAVATSMPPLLINERRLVSNSCLFVNRFALVLFKPTSSHSCVPNSRAAQKTRTVRARWVYQEKE